MPRSPATYYVGVAQWSARCIWDAGVAGSNPVTGTNRIITIPKVYIVRADTIYCLFYSTYRLYNNFYTRYELGSLQILVRTEAFVVGCVCHDAIKCLEDGTGSRRPLT